LSGTIMFMTASNSVVAKSIALVVLGLAIAIVMIVKPALAQEDASSPVPASNDSTSTETITPTPSDAPEDMVAAEPGSSDSLVPQTEAPAPESSDGSFEQPPAGFIEVHIIGTKYVDYFTDGTNQSSFPGDSEVDSHLSEPNAPIPTHEGLTWLRTIGDNLYDTTSGDLEVGPYALQSDGSYIQNAPPFISSTSSPVVLGDSISASDIASDAASTAEHATSSSSSTP
jgi:hypothetical protein